MSIQGATLQNMTDGDGMINIKRIVPKVKSVVYRFATYIIFAMLHRPPQKS